MLFRSAAVGYGTFGDTTVQTTAAVSAPGLPDLRTLAFRLKMPQLAWAWEDGVRLQHVLEMTQAQLDGIGLMAEDLDEVRRSLRNTMFL